MKRLNTKKLGFTLIEIMVVSMIIMVLTVLVVVNLQDSKMKSRDSRRIVDLNVIAAALGVYKDSTGNYATDLSNLDTSAGKNSGGVIADLTGTNWEYWSDTSKVGLKEIEPGYIDKLPRDPLNTATNAYFYYYEPVSWTNSQYGVTCPTDTTCAFMLSANLENNSDSRRRAGCNNVIVTDYHDYCVVAGGAQQN